MAILVAFSMSTLPIPVLLRDATAEHPEEPADPTQSLGDMAALQPSVLPPHVAGVLILPQPHVAGVPQVSAKVLSRNSNCPTRHRPEPSANGHLLRCEAH